MTKERLNELSNYYKMSADFLEEIISNAPETAEKSDIEKAMTTMSLFKDTYEILSDYSKTFQEQ